MFQTKVIETKYILSSVTSSRNSCRLWYVEKYGTARKATDDNTIRRMRFACRGAKATHTHTHTHTHIFRIRNTYCFFMAAVVTRTRFNVMWYVHCNFESHPLSRLAIYLFSLLLISGLFNTTFSSLDHNGLEWNSRITVIMKKQL